MRRTPPPPDFKHILVERSDLFSKAFSDARYMDAARRCQEKYHHWHKVRFIARAEELDPGVLWALVKLGRQIGLRSLPLTDVNGRRLTCTIPDRVQHELMLVDQQLAGNLALADEAPLTESQRDRFIISALMEEAIASSQLEGASTVHRVAKEMLRRNREPRDRGERMIANNYRAIQFMRAQVRTPLTIDLLIELQRILTEGTLDDPGQCGRLRTPGDRVSVEDPYGEELHMPPPASSLEARLRSLCDFANEPTMGNPRFIHPVVRAIALHFQIGYDHPFCDGNGRTARALFYWSMLRDGYWLFEFLPISRLIYRSPARYGQAFQYVETDDFDLTYFLDYHTRIIRLTRQDLREYLARKRREVRSAQEAFRTPDINDRQRLFLLDALDRPQGEYTIESYRVRHDISYFTARADLLTLERLGYLIRSRSGKKFVFRPTKLIREHAHTGEGT